MKLLPIMRKAPRRLNKKKLSSLYLFLFLKRAIIEMITIEIPKKRNECDNAIIILDSVELKI